LKESEKEESRIWLKTLTSLIQQADPAIRAITSLHIESTPDDWAKAFCADNIFDLMTARQRITEIPKPNAKELRKLEKLYSDLIKACLLARDCFVNACEAEGKSKFKNAQVIYWASFANDLLKDLAKKIGKVQIDNTL
jgi:hypothetical protein